MHGYHGLYHQQLKIDSSARKFNWNLMTKLISSFSSLFVRIGRLRLVSFMWRFWVIDLSHITLIHIHKIDLFSVASKKQSEIYLSCCDERWDAQYVLLAKLLGHFQRLNNLHQSISALKFQTVNLIKTHNADETWITSSNSNTDTI